MAARRRNRQGIGSLAGLPAQLQQALGPMIDVLQRVILTSDVAAIKQIAGTVDENLDPASTNAQIVARVNEVAQVTNLAIAKINEVIVRLQED